MEKARQLFSRSKEKKAQSSVDASLGGPEHTADHATGSSRKDIATATQLWADPDTRTVSRLGVTVLHEPSKPTAANVDIVFVHGLTGDPASTWLHTASGTHWPANLLSRDLSASRILSFGYDADVVNFWSPVSQNRIGNHALNMLGDLTRLRENSDTEGRKIVFVVHSLGGLVTQDCLCLSRRHPEKHLRQISVCTIGIVFLGTPHYGADLAAWAKFGTSIARTVKHANTNIVSVLEPGSEMLARVQDEFHGLLRKRKDEKSEMQITCFYEELPLHVIGKIVEMNSAILPGYASYGIHANHMDMTKFNKDDKGYESVLGELRRWVKLLQPTLGSSRTAKPLFMVPFTRDAKFIDRPDHFKTIEERRKTQSRVALSGIGGVGKSQIAIEYCYRYRDNHPDAHVVWVHSSTAQRLNQAYRDIARKLNLPAWDDAKVDTLRLVFEWFNEVDNGQWLMILDNADDVDTFFAKSTSTTPDSERVMPLVDYLPQSSQGLILITTRDSRVGERLADRHASISVNIMSSLEAQYLLRSQSKRLDDGNDDHSRLLVDALGHIPLAITQAAAFISENNLALADYLEMLHTDDSDLQDLLDEDLGDLRRDSESQNSVIRTWKLSYELISKQKPRAAEMLLFMAVLDRQGIPKSLLRNDVDRNIDVTTALGLLQAFSLISAQDGGSHYEIHRLVQLATRRWMEVQGTKQKWQERALHVLAETFPRGKFENWTVCESLMPHAQTVIQCEHVKEACPKQFASLLRNMAVFDQLQGRYEIACTRILAAYGLREKLFGLEHPETLSSMNNLASTYRNQGRWDEAEKLHVQVLKTSKRVLGEEHRDTLTSMGNLALVYWDQGRWDDVEKLELQVLNVRKRVLGEEHPDTLISMNNLAITYWDRGRHDDALELMKRVVDLSTKIIGANHPDTLGKARCLDEWSSTST
ncbi:MAG: hypothetical protein Q9191_001103 [Dirinaria sp. TL-2023a]